MAVSRSFIQSTALSLRHRAMPMGDAERTDFRVASLLFTASSARLRSMTSPRRCALMTESDRTCRMFASRYVTTRPVRRRPMKRTSQGCQVLLRAT